MTARLLSASFESPSSRFNTGFSNSPATSSKRAERASKSTAPDRSNTSGEIHPIPFSDVNLVRSNLIEALPQGVIVVCRNFKPMYWNGKANDLCRTLLDVELSSRELPIEILEVCYRLLREQCAVNSSLVMECQTSTGYAIRVTVRWLQPTTVRPCSAQASTTFALEEHEAPQGSMLVFLENRNEVLRQELQIERQKYDLTEREAEIWMLLRQEYTYQEIAKLLQISLNTVKTHVKNVYAKKRSCQGKDKFWCAR